jgi:acyl-coenzyme A thioesterase PaaI-like protein
MKPCPHLHFEEALRLEKPYIGDKQGSFVLDSDFLEMVLLKSQQPDTLEGKVWFSEKTSGPPGHVHGGCQAAVLDEMMGSTAWSLGHPVVAAHIKVEFLEMVPYAVELSVRGRVIDKQNRKVRVEAEIYDQQRQLARSEGLFIILKDEQKRKLDAYLK